MATTAPAPSNKLVKFKGDVTRERPRAADMPLQSKAQARLMFAAEEGDVPGISPSVGKEFTKGLSPGSIKSLPARVAKPKGKRNPSALARKAHAEGRISNAQYARMGR